MSMLTDWIGIHERPPDCRLTPDQSHPLRKGLVFAGGLRLPGSNHYHDLSGYGNHGTLTNMNPATDWVWDSYLNRWGCNYAKDDPASYIGVPNIGIGLSDYTVATWAVPSADKLLAITARVSSGAYEGWSLVAHSGTSYRVRVAIDFGASEISVTGNATALIENVPIHAAFTASRVGLLTVYANGKNEGSTSISSRSAVDVPATELHIGKDVPSAFNMDGSLFDLFIWKRALSPAEIAALADPSDVMLSGLILPPKRRSWAVGGIAPVELVVGDAECVVESEAPALTQHQVLTVGGSESLVESESPTLTQHQVLTVGGSECLVESESPALAQHYQALTVGDAECIVESDAPALTQHQVLVVADAECLVESETPSLTQHQVLMVGDAESIVESESPALVQHQVLAVAVSMCVVESESPTLIQHQVLAVGDSESIVESQNVTLNIGGGTTIFAQQSLFMSA